MRGGGGLEILVLVFYLRIMQILQLWESFISKNLNSLS